MNTTFPDSPLSIYSQVPGDSIPESVGSMAGDDSHISPIESVSVPSVSSDYSSGILSPGTVILLSICLYFYAARGRLEPLEFG